MLERLLKMATSRSLIARFGAFLILVLLFAFDWANAGSGKSGTAEQASSSELAGGWHFVRSHNPNGATDAISIMHAADTSRSDLDLAGIMIRCSDSGAEVVVVTLPALPFRSRPRVALGKPGNDIQFEAKVAPPGTAILLPKHATTLVSGPWQSLDDLFIRIDNDQSTIRGVVKLTGLEQAFMRLNASCPRH
jgi:hypothetical protein